MIVICKGENMISNINCNRPNSVSFGNRKFASKTFNQFTQNAVDIFKKCEMDDKKLHGIDVRKIVSYDAVDDKTKVSMFINKTFVNNSNLAVKVSHGLERKDRNLYQITLATGGKNKNQICEYLYDSKKTKIVGDSKNNPITKEKNEFFEKYVPLLLKPFIK
jgi:hypothetical protein